MGKIKHALRLMPNLILVVLLKEPLPHGSTISETPKLFPPVYNVLSQNLRTPRVRSGAGGMAANALLGFLKK